MERIWNVYILTAMALVACALLASCAHPSLEQRINEKLARESDMTTQSRLSASTTEAIETTPGLTEDQRSRLFSLRETTRTEMAAMRDESIKLRALLVKDVVSETYDAEEVQAIKSRLKKLENRRLSMIFEAIDQANGILGHEARKNSALMEQFFEPRGSRMN